MRPQQNILLSFPTFFLNKKSILHLTRWMVFRKIKGREIMPVIFYFWAISNAESESFKDFNNSVSRLRKWVQVSDLVRNWRKCQINFNRRRACAVIYFFSKLCQFRFSCLFKLI